MNEQIEPFRIAASDAAIGGLRQYRADCAHAQLDEPGCSSRLWRCRPSSLVELTRKPPTLPASQQEEKR